MRDQTTTTVPPCTPAAAGLTFHVDTFTIQGDERKYIIAVCECGQHSLVCPGLADISFRSGWGGGVYHPVKNESEGA